MLLFSAISFVQFSIRRNCAVIRFFATLQPTMPIIIYSEFHRYVWSEQHLLSFICILVYVSVIETGTIRPHLTHNSIESLRI